MADHEHISILVIEDNPGDYVLIEEYLQEEYATPEISQAKTFAIAREILASAASFDTVLLDLSLPDGNGIKLVSDVLDLADHTPVIVLTGYANMDFGIETLSIGVSDYLIKDDLRADLLKKSISYSIERKKLTRSLEISERRFKALVQEGSDMIAIIDPEANYQYVSPSVESILGYSVDYFTGKNALDFIHEEDKQRLVELITDLPSEQVFYIEPYRFRDADGNWHWLETYITNMLDNPAVGGIVANTRDVTSRIEQEAEIHRSLKEKEALLAEIHHRVKNNLAVISAMLQLQAYREGNEVLADKLFDSVSRIKAMANIHEHLYRSDHFSRIDFAKNLKMLVSEVIDTIGKDKQVQTVFDCEEIELNVNQAIPCSLIVNEIITNSMKHAFKKDVNGEIHVELFQKDSKIVLKIKDNGPGFPADLDPEQSDTLGMQIISVLSQQLKADLTYRNRKTGHSGTIFILKFNKTELKGI